MAGDSRSPRPVPTAQPPVSAKGTSLPSSRRDRGKIGPAGAGSQSSAHATRAAAASAEPPARPPATGIPLRMVNRAAGGTPACVASNDAACQARFFVPAGSEPAPLTFDRHGEVVGRYGDELIEQVNGQIDRQEIMEAVRVVAHRREDAGSPSQGRGRAPCPTQAATFPACGFRPPRRPPVSFMELPGEGLDPTSIGGASVIDEVSSTARVHRRATPVTGIGPFVRSSCRARSSSIRRAAYRVRQG